MIRRPPRSTLFPSRRSSDLTTEAAEGVSFDTMIEHQLEVNRILMADPNVAYVMSQVGFGRGTIDRKSTRLNSSHLGISYAVFCLKKKKRTPRVSCPAWSL